MSKIKIASFNVNSIKARLPQLINWLKTSNPDIVLLQEIKCLEKDFPFEDLFDLGYNSVVSGQKSYNGVAILSKFKIEEVTKKLPNAPKLVKVQNLFGEEEQARYIEALINVKLPSIDNQTTIISPIRVASIYVPNGGGELGSDESLENSAKFIYKMKFYDALKAHFSELLTHDEIQVFGGDYNVSVEDIDVFDAKSLRNTVCFHDLERQKFRSILNLGLIDSYRAKNQNSQAFSWWDYRGGSWQHNKGLRIDYLLTSPLASDKITSATIEDKGVRDQEKASDHTPVCIELEIF
jgi:exodeoxyribonuclease-3